MVMMRWKRFGRRSIYAAVLCCIVLYLLVYSFLNFAGLARFCNADVYADMQLAKRIWEEKTLFPKSWQFGNQFYVAATPVVAAGLYGMLGNIDLAMALATQIMTVLLLLSFCWMIRALTKDLLTFLAACLVLMAANVAPYGPYSVNAMLFYLQSSFYSCYLITMFIAVGDYLRCYTGDRRSKGMWALALLLSFAMGMQSLRQTVVMVLPILVCELFASLHRKLRHQKMWKRESMVHAISYAGANVAGIAVMTMLKVENSSIYGKLEAAPAGSLAERLNSVAAAICEITSLNYVIQGECGRAMTVVILSVILLVLTAAALWLWNICREKTARDLCWLLFLVGIVGVFMATVVLNITLRGIYAFLWFPLAACSLIYLNKRLPQLAQYGIILLLCLLSVVGLKDSYCPYIEILTSGEAAAEEQLSQWIVDQGYRYVYGDYWGAATAVAAHSQGKLDAGCWHSPENVYCIEMANTPRNIYGEKEKEQAVYVFDAADVEAGIREAQSRGVSLTLVAQIEDYRVYTSPVPLMGFWD